MARCIICNASSDTDAESWNKNFIWDDDRQEYICTDCVFQIYEGEIVHE